MLKSLFNKGPKEVQFSDDEWHKFFAWDWHPIDEAGNETRFRFLERRCAFDDEWREYWEYRIPGTNTVGCELHLK